MLYSVLFASTGVNAHENYPLLADADKQWQMFGGPNGNNQITTDNKVPISWSARTNKNIKWKTELPAGGQSGITVWQNKVFITINMPVDTPKFESLNTDYQKVLNHYNTLFNQVVSSLSTDNTYQHLQRNLINSQEQWQKFIDNRKNQKLPWVSNKVLNNTPEKLTVVNAEQDLHQYILSQSKELAQYQIKKDSLSILINQGIMGKDILLYCLDANTGALLWQRKIKGVTKTLYNYAFSDATSPSPMTDGRYVWAINASGGMAAFTMEGKELWSRTWTPTGDRPFNKQYDSIMYGDVLLNVEPPLTTDNTRHATWNYLHGINKYTGKHEWVSKDPLTHYSTPVLGKTKDNIPAVMIGRGGPHEVPEGPEGLSLIDLRTHAKEQSLWTWQPPKNNKKSWGGTDIQMWNKNVALWIEGSPRSFELHKINPTTGKTLSVHDLNTVEQHLYDTAKKRHILKPKIMLKQMEIQPYTNVIIDDRLYFMLRHQPFIAFHDLKTGKNVHLEIPTEVVKQKSHPDKYRWKTKETTDQLNAKGQRHNGEERSRGNGSQKAFLGTPIVVNNYIYFTNAHGLTYVLDTTKAFSPEALVAVNDIGAQGQTFSLNTMAYSQGKLFHRSIKALYCIE